MNEPHLLKYICNRRILDRAIVRLALLKNLPHHALTARPAVFARSGHLYWVGYLEEKDRARKQWVKFSGQEFQSPVQ
jgi:hypothetical protein